MDAIQINDAITQRREADLAQARATLQRVEEARDRLAKATYLEWGDDFDAEVECVIADLDEALNPASKEQA